MEETYCGKTCAECTHGGECPGCKLGPGGRVGGDCQIASCVRSKGHETCQTCGFRGNCGNLRGRDQVPDLRRRRQEAETQRLAAAARKSVVLGKWLWLLFWLVLPGTVAGLLTTDVVVEYAPALDRIGEILSFAVTALYSLILLKLTAQEDRYRIAGICGLVGGGISLVLALVTGTGETPVWSLLLSVPAAIVSLVGEYHEFTAHAAVLRDVDRELSEKWERLWKWNLGALLAMLGSIVLMLFIPVLGVLTLLAAAIAVCVVAVLKLVYLYRSARRFREFSAELHNF